MNRTYIVKLGSFYFYYSLFVVLFNFLTQYLKQAFKVAAHKQCVTKPDRIRRSRHFGSNKVIYVLPVTVYFKFCH